MTSDAAPPTSPTSPGEPGEAPEQQPDLAAGEAALIAALVDLERHIGARGWEQPPRLFALVSTTELIEAEPALAAEIGLRRPEDGGLPDSLTAIEQDDFGGPDGSADLLDDLSRIAWPDAVAGCAVSLVSSFLPTGHEDEIPDGPEAAAFVAAHPQRRDVRVVVGVDRTGHQHGVARLESQPGELLAAPDLVPGLAAALAHTLA